VSEGFHIAAAIGLVGDALTFVGGFVLAKDAFDAAKTHSTKQREKEGFKDLSGIGITLAGVRIQGESDVDLAYFRESAHRAKWGVGIMTLGFFFQIVARIVEMAGH
jgi:hypothetical protein